MQARWASGRLPGLNPKNGSGVADSPRQPLAHDWDRRNNHAHDFIFDQGRVSRTRALGLGLEHRKDCKPPHGLQSR